MSIVIVTLLLILVLAIPEARLLLCGLLGLALWLGVWILVLGTVVFGLLVASVA